MAVMWQQSHGSLIATGNERGCQHNPLDTWQQPLELCMKSKHVTELGELDMAKWFGKDVSRVFISDDMGHSDVLLLDLFADPVVGMVNMFHGALVFRVLQYLDG
jgi:hypothetical protein